MSAKGVNKFSKGFSKENLKEHFNNHGHQYANMTAEDYNNYALDLIQQPVSNDVLEYKTTKGAVVRYKVSTNDYVKGYPNTGIATMYKPKGNKLKGYAYYKKLETSEGITND